MLEFDFLGVVRDASKPLKALPLPAIVTDAEFTVYWWNGAASSICPELCSTQGLSRILEEFDRGKILHALLEHGNYTIDGAAPTTSLRVSLTPILRKGAVAGVIALMIGGEFWKAPAFSGVTSHTAQSLSDGVRRAVEGIFAATDIASQKAEMMDLGWVKGGFEQIGRYGYRIMRIVDNISAYTHLRSGRVELQPAAVDLFAALQTLDQPLRGFAGDAGASLELIVPDRAAYVMLDFSWFELAFYNVLHNALYFTRPGNKVTVIGESRGADVTLRVRDSGQGIPAHVLPHVFQPFFCHDAGGRSPTVGLGLAITKMICEAHGGAVTIQSTADEGTEVALSFSENTFSRGLPLAQGADRPVLDDRFTRLYTFLGDLAADPYPGDR